MVSLVRSHKHFISIYDYPISKEKVYEFRFDTKRTIKERLVKRLKKKGFDARLSYDSKFLYVPYRRQIRGVDF